MIRGAFFIPLCASQYRNKEPTILENESGRLFVALIGSVIHVKSQLLGPCAPFKSFVRIR